VTVVARRTTNIADAQSAAPAAAIRVVLADDSLLVREAIERILEREEGVELVASCADGTALLAAVERERPAVVVTDVRMPPRFEDEGIEVARTLRETHPQIGVVVLSQYADPRLGLALLEHGSDGRAYLLKERVHDRRQLTSAIETVAHGGSVMDARVVEAMIAERSSAADSPLAELSPRELEILGEIAQGKSNARIATELVLTKRAVEKHINAIFLKLGLSYAEDVSRRVKAALIYLAERRG
jgi:DNA-binding NarL/FixJ family response regulator